MTGSESFAYRFNGRWNQTTLAWTAAQVEQFQTCRGVAGGAAGQMQVAVVAAGGVVKAFQRRRGAAQQQRDGVMLGACHGQRSEERRVGKECRSRGAWCLDEA